MATGRGEIGRHTRLRIWRREPWGFESLRPDKEEADHQSLLFIYTPGKYKLAIFEYFKENSFKQLL